MEACCGQNAWGVSLLDVYIYMYMLLNNILVKFTKHIVSDMYKGNQLSYDVWRRPVWDWVMKLVQDPSLAPHFEWDAKRLYKFNGESWIRFHDELVTGDLWWELQVSLM